MPEDKTNPCRFKQVCLQCTKVDHNDRPEMCVGIKCNEYTLCHMCKKNKTLYSIKGQMICKGCINSSNYKHQVYKDTKAESELQSSGKATLVNPHSVTPRIISITPPGVPPVELNENEKEYYNSRWNQYKGYYRNPAAFFICHMIIIEEINLSYLNSKSLEARGEAEIEYSKQRQVAINMLKLLTDQLPDKEAEEIMDDEKAMSVIYDTYIKEKKDRYRTGVSRLLSPEAIALAPVLPFSLDCRRLLERCGYSVIEIDEAVEKVSNGNLREMQPEELLKFFGFNLKEEYALPYKVDRDISPESDELEEENDYHLG